MSTNIANAARCSSDAASVSGPRSAGDAERTPPGPEDPPIEVPVLDLNPRLDRRRLLARGLALAAGALPAASLLAACGGGGMMGRRMPDWMMSGGGMMGSGMMEEMQVIHELLVDHEAIRRRVENVPGGIRAWTTSRDPELAELIATHVGQMRARIEEGDPIRHMDPLFREIFEHHEEIEMDVGSIAGGVLVIETSADPRVELLIRQHAHRAVSEFVAEGMARAMEPTPLPLGYTGS
jgi:hypothetical protein